MGVSSFLHSGIQLFKSPTRVRFPVQLSSGCRCYQKLLLVISGLIFPGARSVCRSVYFNGRIDRIGIVFNGRRLEELYSPGKPNTDEFFSPPFPLFFIKLPARIVHFRRDLSWIHLHVAFALEMREKLTPFPGTFPSLTHKRDHGLDRLQESK